MRKALSDGFFSHFRNRAPLLNQAVGAELSERLAELLKAAHEAWPDLSVSEDEFLRRIAQGIEADPEAGNILEALGAIHAPGDLYLACACASGDARAIAALDRIYRQETEHAMERVNVRG